MTKIYGFKDEELKRFSEFLREKKPNNLTLAFKEYGDLYGKAQGTVRNMYYALAKKTRADESMRQAYLGTHFLKVQKPEIFTEENERELLRKVLMKKVQGYSVRRAINELAEGDVKRALRYQNKYRNLLKTKPLLVEEVSSKLGVNSVNYLKGKKDLYKAIDAEKLNKVKEAIDKLVERISFRIQKENYQLKERINYLEKENAFLRGGKGFDVIEKSAILDLVKDNDKNAIS